ncbi:MAG: SLC13 family permease, partial [Desulfatirhabdiaceae bacterium]
MMLVLWIFRSGNVPYAAGAMLLTAGGLIAGLKLGILTAGFVSSGLWILIPALYFGFALQKTGLGKRIAFQVLKSFKPSFATMILAWFIIGIIISILTPSITLRVAIIMPIALSCIEACKLEDRSRGAALISLVAWAIAVLPGTGWLTCSLWGPVFVGYFSKELSEFTTWNSWFQIMALPWMMTTIIFTIAVYILLKSKEDISISRDTFEVAYKYLGKITREEIITGIILVASFLLFSTEPIHHIPTASTAMSAFFCLMMFRIISFQEICTGVSWDVIIFFGIAFSLPSIIGNARVAEWMSTLIEPTIFAIAANPLILIIGFTFLLWVIRLVDLPWGLTTLALTVPLLIPLYDNYGIHPVVIATLFTAAGNCFFMCYQQPFLMLGEAVSQGRGWSPNHVSIAGLAYA